MPLREPHDPLFGGHTVATWFDVFWGTHEPDGMGGVRRIEWPDGGGFLEQAAVTVTLMGLVRDEVIKQAEVERKRQSNGK